MLAREGFGVIEWDNVEGIVYEGEENRTGMAEIADVVIVGGGILGVSLAYELARRTLRVTLLEAHALGSGTTGSGFGWINATSKADADETYFQMNAASLHLYEELLNRHHTEPTGISSGGTLFWSQDAESRLALRAKAESLQARGYLATNVNQREMEALEPHLRFHTPGAEEPEGCFCPMDKWVDASRLVRFLADHARRHNAEIREYSPVTELIRDSLDAIAMVRTEAHQITTRTVIIASGNQTPQLIAKLQLSPEQRNCVPMKRVAGILTETAPQSAPKMIHRVLYPPDAGGLHFRPTPSGGLLIGADDTDIRAQQESLSAGQMREIGRELITRAAEWITGLSPDALATQASTYICQRPIPADDRPIVGNLPGVQGLFVAVSHSGVTLAPYLSSLLAEEIIHRKAPDALLPYRPERFLVG